MRYQNEIEDIESDLAFSVPTGPRRQSMKTHSSNKPERSARRKKNITHRKGNTKGGIHQRGNKRMSW